MHRYVSISSISFRFQWIVANDPSLISTSSLMMDTLHSSPGGISWNFVLSTSFFVNKIESPPHSSSKFLLFDPVELRQSLPITLKTFLTTVLRDVESFSVKPRYLLRIERLICSISLNGSMRYRCVLLSTQYIFRIDVLHVL